MSHDDIDPITLEVVCEGLRAIAKEMRATIINAEGWIRRKFDDIGKS